MVVWAEESTVVEVGTAAVGPGFPVVGLAPGARDVATGPVPQAQGGVLGAGEEPSRATVVENL